METTGEEQQRIRTRESLDGLSLGDAFGDNLFRDSPNVARKLRDRELSSPPWEYTDDT